MNGFEFFLSAAYWIVAILICLIYSIILLIYYTVVIGMSILIYILNPHADLTPFFDLCKIRVFYPIVHRMKQLLL